MVRIGLDMVHTPKPYSVYNHAQRGAIASMTEMACQRCAGRRRISFFVTPSLFSVERSVGPRSCPLAHHSLLALGWKLQRPACSCLAKQFSPHLSLAPFFYSHLLLAIFLHLAVLQVRACLFVFL